MRAAYSAGVVARLIEEGIDFPFVTGISAGTSCLANYLSRDARRTRRSFVEFAAHPRMGDWRSFVRGRGMFDSQFIYQETAAPNEALPYDWQAYLAHPAEFAIGAFNVDTGAETWWHRADVHRLDDLLVRVRASSSMPILMPVTTVDGERFLDGALGPNAGIALDAALDSGHERMVVVLTRERSYAKRPFRLSRLMSAYLRGMPAVADALATRWRRYNEQRERMFELEREGRLLLICPERMPIESGERDVAKLASVFATGDEDAKRLLPRIREFAEA